jgi:hypothetical protein
MFAIVALHGIPRQLWMVAWHVWDLGWTTSYSLEIQMDDLRV